MTALSPSLSTRVVRPELMDQAELGEEAHRKALAGLARLNWWSAASRPYRKALLRLAGVASQPLTILDVATGAGDVPVALALWARRAGIDLEVAACDRSCRAVGWARRRGKSVGIDLDAFVHDVVCEDLHGRYDVVTCSLFLHHLSRDSAREVLARLARAARRAVVLCDLRRSPAGLALAALASQLLTRSPVVHTDAVLSARAAFTPHEVVRLARDAGLNGVDVQRCWPQRFTLTWWR
ncbi:MAG: methyltransferase domain-containing protein [Acidobacteria bacterium]|jgi:2-polyprenyl-3-methyl-5-hydroxy-6-metoxy-1,4-benzoquinol methylase|nr:methyltransferase domain-containing protein [Acidobacteriota bacterium]